MMNTTLLRLGKRSKEPGMMTFIVPGAPHPVKLTPPARSFWFTWSVQWPALGGGGWELRKARLDWHRALVKGELWALIVQINERETEKR